MESITRINLGESADSRSVSERRAFEALLKKGMAILGNESLKLTEEI